jgi:hypothetical protein
MAPGQHVAVEEGSMESGWAKLPEQLLTKVKKALQAAEQCAPQDGGRCKASATVRLVCSGWKCRHDALGDAAVAETGRHRRGGVLVRRWLAGPQGTV